MRDREKLVGGTKGYSCLASTGSSLPGMESKQPFTVKSHKSLILWVLSLGELLWY